MSGTSSETQGLLVERMRYFSGESLFEGQKSPSALEINVFPKNIALLTAPGSPRMCQEPIRRETTEGSFDQQKRSRLFRYSD